MAGPNPKLFEPLALLALRTLKPDIERWSGGPADVYLSDSAVQTVALKVAGELDFRKQLTIERELRNLVGRTADLREAGTLLADEIDKLTDSIELKAVVLRQTEYFLSEATRTAARIMEAYAEVASRSDITKWDDTKAPIWARDWIEDLDDRDRRNRPGLLITLVVFVLAAATNIGLTVTGRLPWPALVGLPILGGLMYWRARLEVLGDHGDELESYLASVDPEETERRVRAFLGVGDGTTAQQEQLVRQVMVILTTRVGDRLAEFMDDKAFDDAEAGLAAGDTASVLRVVERANPFYGVVVRQELEVLLSELASTERSS